MLQTIAIEGSFFMKMFFVKLIILVITLKLAHKHRYKIMNYVLGLQIIRDIMSQNSMKLPFGYSKSYLSRFFKKHFGICLNRYINILKLRHYLLLMQEKKHTNTYCAFESGFDSMGTFYRVFKQEFNCSPGEYFSNK